MWENAPDKGVLPRCCPASGRENPVPAMSIYILRFFGLYQKTKLVEKAILGRGLSWSAKAFKITLKFI